ncbi:MAG TPA: glutamine--fructose-6-phosphate transaminase (isomerizing) [Halanaerobiales bacterium]|nr:glutamine--fructose-6-phosphate transaminase (isomerizing) [Halanaerobiales bacterium]
MCGIVGYTGSRSVSPILIEGLKRLEYRGYDSAGIAVKTESRVEVIKKKGKLRELEELVQKDPPEGEMGIGHTRWATHGVPSDRNSHPHTGCNGDFVVVHNGIIENFQRIKDQLEERGHIFSSETDTEVIAHLLEEEYQGNMREAIIQLFNILEGSYALLVLSRKEPDKLYAVRQDSPLIIGRGNGENYIASDIPAFLKYTNEFYLLDDEEFAEVQKDSIVIYDIMGEPLEKEIFEVNWDSEMVEKSGYQHFMLKEIHEQPDALRRVLGDRISPGNINLEEINLFPESIKDYNKVQIIACGTASYAGIVARYIIEELARIPVELDTGSEFRYRNPLIDDKTLVIVVSQSGETADTLAGLRLARKRGARVIALTNVVGSSIAREADDVLFLKAGPEIAVASTKAYITMLAAFYLLAILFAKGRGTLDSREVEKLISEVLRLPELSAEVLRSSKDKARELAGLFKETKSSFYIGRNTDYALSLEGALKLKEISYIHAEAYQAGELKHGPLALIEEGVPVVALASRLSLFDKIMSNIKEVKARGGTVIALTFNGKEEINKSVDHVFFIPRINELFAGAVAIIPLQLLAYYTALEYGYNVDQPRNLAKSVTVE